MKKLSRGAGFFKGLLAGCSGDRRDAFDDAGGGNARGKPMPAPSPRHLSLSQEVVDELLFPSSPSPARGFSGSARNISPIPPINGGEPEPAHPIWLVGGLPMGRHTLS